MEIKDPWSMTYLEYVDAIIECLKERLGRTHPLFSKDIFVSAVSNEPEAALIEIDTGKDITILPWAKNLDKEEQQEFRNELVNSVMTAIATDNWDNIETVIEDWKATAETEQNEAAMAAIKTRLSKNKYIPRKPR